MSVLVANNAVGELLVGIGATETAILLAQGQGTRFPAPVPQKDWFYVTAQDETGVLEVMECTARNGDTLTVVRDVSHTGARTFKAGSVIELRPCAELFNDKADAKEFKTYMEASEETHSETKETIEALAQQLTTTIAEFESKVNELKASIQTVSNSLGTTKSELSTFKTTVAATYLPTSTASNTYVKKTGDTISGSLTVSGSVTTPNIKTATLKSSVVQSGVAY